METNNPSSSPERHTIMLSTLETSTKGRWSRVPALIIDDYAVIVKGQWIKKAIVNAEEWLPAEIKCPGDVVQALKSKRFGLKADFFTFTQKPPCVERKYEYRAESDSVAALPTSSFSEWWDGLPQESRKNTRRAQKRGVTVKVQELDDQLCRQIVELNNDNPVRQGKRYTHFGKSFEEVKRDQESFPGRSDFICAYVGDELVGLVKLIYRGKVASILTFLPKASHHDKRPANALMTKTVEVCAEKGVEWLTFGMFNYGNKRDSSLREFKERNGFREILIPRYYVPLTIKGDIALRLGLHRGVMGVLPYSVIKNGVKARAILYNIKTSISRCSLMSERSNRNRQMECSNPPAGSNQ